MRLTHLFIQIALVALLVTGVACQRKAAETTEGATQEQTEPAPAEAQPEQAAPAEQPAEGTGQ